jgi:RHS repeat-associated protein
MEATSGVMEGLLSVPDSGGSLRGLGERFQPDLLRGTGNFSVPIPLPKGPNGQAPSLSLRYSTGNGRSAFGLGWQLAGPLQITRSADKRLPRYDDSDEFTLSGADTLVPVGGGRYRPRSDTQFWKIVRDGAGWQVQNKQGCVYRLGSAEGSRTFDGSRIHAWHVDQETDCAGNAITYSYERDGGTLYLSEVAWSIYKLRFVYEARPDVVEEGRAGFPLRTARRCAAIERRCESLAQPLLARYELTYTQATGAGHSLLAQVKLVGFDASNATEEFPPLRFDYSQFDGRRARYMRIGATADPPPSLEERGTTLVDMDGDGLADVLQTDVGGHRYWPNRGDGSFGGRRSLRLAPAGMEVGKPGVSFADLNGDGAADLFRVTDRLGVAVANTGAGGWAERPMVYRQEVPLRLSSTASRLVDLDGDGVVDVLESGKEGFTIVYNLRAQGWSRPQAVLRKADASQFPDVDLNAKEVYLADMNGDGLTDVVFAASGRVDYWPSRGYGNWGARVRMRNAPVLPQRYDPARLFLSDIDGDGVSDLLYVDFDRVYYWLNQSGTAWSQRFEIPFVPPPNTAAAHMVDLLGTGTAGLAWSSRDTRGSATGYRYLDLSGGVKPYLLTHIDHGLGGSTDLTYTTTTALRSADAAASKPWNSYFPFPVQVVAEIKYTDAVTGRVDRQRIRYHRGYYDGLDREFRGFERVELETPGDASTPTTVQESRFYLGSMAAPTALAALPAAVRARERALSGSPLEVKVYEVDGGGSRTQRKSATFQWDAREEFNDGQHFVYFPHAVKSEAREQAPGEADRIETAEYTYDAFGNMATRRQTSRFADQAPASALVKVQNIAYAVNEEAWLVGNPSVIETRDTDGKLLNQTRHYYDGDPYTGLPSGQVTRGLLRRTTELALADWAIPAGYAAEIDAAWGLTHEGEGWYRTSVCYDHDSAGNMAGQQNGLGARRTVTYDANHLFPLSVTEPDGRHTEASFDPRTAQPLELRLAEGKVTRYTYSPLGRLIGCQETASDGSLQLVQVFTVNYGDFGASPARPGRIVSIRPRDAGRNLAEFPQNGDPAAVTGASISCDYYDSDGNLLQRAVRGPDAADGSATWHISQRRDYTLGGRSAAEYPNEFVNSPAYKAALPAGAPVRFFYDGLGQVRRVERPDGTRLSARFLVNRIEKRPPEIADNQPAQVERYNARGDLIAVDQPDGAGGVLHTAYERDALGRITSVTDAGGRVSVRYVYAGPGSPARITHADAGERTYWRDAQNQLRQRTDSLGRRLRLEYDVLGRMTRAADATNPAASVVVREMTYDGALLTQAREGSIVQRFTYDAAGRPSSKMLDFGGGASLAIGREYGISGELRAVTYPNGRRVEYRYDGGATLRGASGFVQNIDYDAHGSPTRIAFEGGPTATYSYDDFRRMSTAALAGGGNTIRQITAHYDASGNIIGLRDQAGSQVLSRKFTYDGLYRLTRSEVWQGDPAATLLRGDRYAYTATGDLTRNDEALTGAMVYGDATHPGRLTQAQPAGAGAPAALTYDTSGRLLGFGALRNLKYDLWDRLQEATAPDGSVVTFDYDFTGARVRKRVQSGVGTRETRYAENLYEAGPDGARLQIMIGKLLVAVQTIPAAVAAQTMYVLTDHVGSILAGCDAAGAVRHQQMYSPFGLSLQAASSQDRYIGLPPDGELGLAQFGARYYCPALGRFITPDWFIIENPNRSQRLPQGLNAYSYAINNPLGLRDASGMWFGIDDLIAAAVGFVVGFIAGVIHGAATGQSFGDCLLNGLEGALVGAAGAWLAYNTAGLALGLFGISASSGVGLGIAVGAAVVGGLNGVISGAMQIYDWASWTGWASFLSDSTWGLVGTTLAVLVHGINLFYGNRNYRADLSRRQNRHVYDGGFGFGNFAFTQGNVTSNLQGGYAGAESEGLTHEGQHILQSRLFGPIFQVTYVVWMVVGGIIGFFIGIFAKQGIGKTMEDIGYYDNPWETWSYSAQDPGHHGGDFSWS